VKNPKKVGNEYERKIVDIINEILGSGYTKTKLSGGADHKGDLRDYWQTTPLKNYTIECKYHGSEKEFRRKILLDIKQAITQTPANKNWQLIIHLPNSQIELVVLDLKDYLINDILGQMLVTKKEAKEVIKSLESSKYKLGRDIEKLKAVL